MRKLSGLSGSVNANYNLVNANVVLSNFTAAPLVVHAARAPLLMRQKLSTRVRRTQA